MSVEEDSSEGCWSEYKAGVLLSMTSEVYLRHQRGRMKYDESRKQGLPLTSSAIESTIKQINRRVKGLEKFWSEGGNAMLHLVADRLSQTKVTADFWQRRVDRPIASACQHAA